MARVKRGLNAHRRHKKLLGLTKGYRGTKSKLVKMAHESSLHAGQYAFHGRKRKKIDFRRLWIVRISEASKAEGLPYSKFIDKLTKSQIKIDRKILSDMVINDPETFKKIVAQVQA